MAEPMRCTCTLHRSATHESPAEWEQDPTCEMHYNRAAVVRMLEALSVRLVEARAQIKALQPAPVPVCDCYPGGFTPDTYEGPQRHCRVHGDGSGGDVVTVLTDASLYSYGPALDGLGRVMSVDGVPVPDTRREVHGD